VCTEYSDFPSVGPNVQDFTPMAVPGTNVTLLNVGNK
jgi:hypothetical protein